MYRFNEENVILRMTDITKRFPGTLALDHVRLTCEKGKVHVLLGENGAGKSTLVKVVCGLYSLDEGTEWYDGKEVNFSNVKESMAAGIGMIHQELSLLPERTVAQNIFAGHEPMKRKGIIDIKKMISDSQAILDRLGLDYDPNALVKKLSIAQQQMVEVAKALSHDVKLLIMDEPTSSLTSKEIRTLFGIVRRLTAEGVSIIYISQRMEEIQEIGDCVTVMRDGQYIDTVDAKTATMDDLIAMMVGRKLGKMYERNFQKPEDIIFETRNLAGLRFKNVNISVRSGEIVSLYGLVGAGRSEIAMAAFGYDPIDEGTVRLFGKEIKHPTPYNCVKAGMGFLPEDRKTQGLHLAMPIADNVVEASLGKIFKRGFLNSKRENEIAEKYINDLKIATPGAEKLVGELSGGNQQKVVIAKWLATGCKFLIFDEPTRGIDVGAKSEIYKLMDTLVGQGYGILMISSDLQEVIGVSDRCYVMKDGLITGELEHQELTQERIMQFAFGGKGATE